MADNSSNIAYEKDSIVRLGEDSINITSGEVIVDTNGSVVIANNSSFYYQYNFDTTANRMICDSLKLIYHLEEENGQLSTIYSDDIKINIHIEYYSRLVNEIDGTVSYVDGLRQSINILPYLIHEEKGYIGQLEILCLKEYIKSLQVEVIYEGDIETYIGIGLLELFKSVTREEFVADTVGNNNLPIKIEGYNNGFKVIYDGDDYEPSKVIFMYDIDNVVVGVRLNPNTADEKIIDIETFGTLLE